MSTAVANPATSTLPKPRPAARVGSRGARWGIWILGLLLLAQGAGKLIDPTGYAAALGAFALPWPATHDLLAAAWMAAELLAGVGLLFAGLAPRPSARVARLAAGLAFAIALGYGALTSQAFARGLVVPNCTCFGSYLAQPLSWLVLLQDAYVLLFTAWQLRRIWRWPVR